MFAKNIFKELTFLFLKDSPFQIHGNEITRLPNAANMTTISNIGNDANNQQPLLSNRDSTLDNQPPPPYCEVIREDQNQK